MQSGNVGLPYGKLLAKVQQSVDDRKHLRHRLITSTRRTASDRSMSSRGGQRPKVAPIDPAQRSTVKLQPYLDQVYAGGVQEMQKRSSGRLPLSELSPRAGAPVAPGWKHKVLLQPLQPRDAPTLKTSMSFNVSVAPQDDENTPTPDTPHSPGAFRDFRRQSAPEVREDMHTPRRAEYIPSDDDDDDDDSIHEIGSPGALRMAARTHRIISARGTSTSIADKAVPGWIGHRELHLQPKSSDNVHADEHGHSIVMQKSTVIDYSGCGIGDSMAIALSATLSNANTVETVLFPDNRLTGAGISALMTNLIASHLRTLVLSQNTLGLQGAQAVATLAAHAPFLETLELQKCALGDAGVGVICAKLRAPLRCLLLQRNGCGVSGATALGRLLQNCTTLAELDVSWNNIRGPAAEAFAGGLLLNKSLRNLDISWNGIGSSPENAAARKFAAALRDHPTLMHLNLSHNQLDEEGCHILSDGLSANHTLLGLHMGGNAHAVDPRGFVSSSAGHIPIETHHVMCRIVGRASRDPSWHLQQGCWLCDKWNEHHFVWTYADAGRTEPVESVWLHVSIDNYMPEVMIPLEDGSGFELYRMLPPGKVRYHFSIEGQPHILPISSRHGVTSAVSTDPLDVPRQLNTASIVASKPYDPATSLVVKPREYRRPPEPEASPEPAFNRAASVWAAFQLDTPEVLDAAFHADWSWMRLRALLKTPEETTACSQLLRSHYEMLKNIFRTYARPHAVTWPAFAEFLADIGVMDAGAPVAAGPAAWWATSHMSSPRTAVPSASKTAVLHKLRADELSQMFTQVNYAHISPSIKGKRNPDRALTRCQFMEIIVRVAIKAFPSVDTLSAVTALLDNHVLKSAQLWDPNAIRADLYTHEADAIVRQHQEAVLSLYKAYASENNMMTLADFHRLLGDAGLLSASFTTRDVQRVFVLSIATVTDEMKSLKFSQLAPIEFLEALCRVASIATPMEATEYQSPVDEAHAAGRVAWSHPTSAAGEPVPGPNAFFAKLAYTFQRLKSIAIRRSGWSNAGQGH